MIRPLRRTVFVPIYELTISDGSEHRTIKFCALYAIEPLQYCHFHQFFNISPFVGHQESCLAHYVLYFQEIIFLYFNYYLLNNEKAYALVQIYRENYFCLEHNFTRRTYYKCCYYITSLQRKLFLSQIYKENILYFCLLMSNTQTF